MELLSAELGNMVGGACLVAKSRSSGHDKLFSYYKIWFGGELLRASGSRALPHSSQAHAYGRAHSGDPYRLEAPSGDQGGER